MNRNANLYTAADLRAARSVLAWGVGGRALDAFVSVYAVEIPGLFRTSWNWNGAWWINFVSMCVAGIAVRFGEGTIEIVNGVPVAIFFLEMKQLELEVCDYKNLLSIIGTVCVCNVCVCVMHCWNCSTIW